MKKLLFAIVVCFSIVSWSQITVNEYDTRITYEGENYIYSYKHGLILEQKDKILKVIDANTYGEPFIFENQLILGSSRNGYFKLTDEKKLIPFDTDFLIEEIRKFKINGLKIVEGYSGCFGSSRYSTEFIKFNSSLFVEKNHYYFMTPKMKVLKSDLSIALKNAADRINGEKGDLDFYNFKTKDAKAFKDKIIVFDSIVLFDDYNYDFFIKKVRHHSSHQILQ